MHATQGYTVRNAVSTELGQGEEAAMAVRVVKLAKKLAVCAKCHSLLEFTRADLSEQRDADGYLVEALKCPECAHVGTVDWDTCRVSKE